MKIFAVTFLSLIPIVINAQQDFKIGIKAGVNHANIETGYKNDGRKSGFNAALFANLALCRNFSLQPELGYSEQGAKYAKDFSDRLHYINVPLLVQYSFSRAINIKSGPQLGVLTSYKRTSPPNALVADPNFKKIDAAWVIGADYLFTKTIGITARYNHGLTDISGNAFTMTNRVWQIGLTCRVK